MTAQEIAQQVTEVNDTLSVLHAGLSAAMRVIRTEPLEVDVTVFHANRETVVRRPNPALKRVREISSAIRTLEIRRKKLLVLSQENANADRLANSSWAKLKEKK